MATGCVETGQRGSTHAGGLLLQQALHQPAHPDYAAVGLKKWRAAPDCRGLFQIANESV